MNTQHINDLATIIDQKLNIDKLNISNEEQQEKLEESQMILDEYKDLFYEIQQERNKLEVDFKEADTNLKRLDKETKKKDKSIKDLKGIQEKLKQAEKRVAQLSSVIDKTTSDAQIQTHIETMIRYTMTDLGTDDIEKYIRKNEELHAKNISLDEKINILENEIKGLKQLRKATPGHVSNQDSTRQMSPKYMTRMNPENSKFLDEVIEIDKSIIEHIDVPDNTEFFEEQKSEKLVIKSQNSARSKNFRSNEISLADQTNGFESKELAVKLKRDKVDLKDPLSSTRSKVKKNIHIKGSSGIKNKDYNILIRLKL